MIRNLSSLSDIHKKLQRRFAFLCKARHFPFLDLLGRVRFRSKPKHSSAKSISIDMPPPSRPYVVLTASDAADFQTAQLESDPSAQEHQSIVSLNQLLEYRSKTHPDAIVAGFPSLSKDGEWSWNTWCTSKSRIERALFLLSFPQPTAPDETY
jgi:hypothetical protein